MKKVTKLLLSMFAISFFMIANMASADVYHFSNSDLGVIRGMESSSNSVIQNLDRTDYAVGKDGKGRIIEMSGSSVKIYAPFSGDGWEKKPEIEKNLRDKNVLEGWDDNKEGNSRGMEILNDKLYVAYFGNDIGFNGVIDDTTRIVCYDMAKNFKKINQFIFKPEEKDPDAAANAMDVVAYNGKVYGLYVGLSKKGRVLDSMWFNTYAVYDSFVVEFDENLNPTGREVKIPTRANYIGMNTQASSYAISGNQLLVYGAGDNMTNGYRDENGVSVINLDTMELTTFVSGKSFGEEWNTPVASCTATPSGDVYILMAGFPFYNSNMFGAPDFKECSDKVIVYKTSLSKMLEIEKLAGNTTMEELEAMGLMKKLWETTWSGSVQEGPEITYDYETNCVYWMPGEVDGIYRYKCDDSTEPELINVSQVTHIFTTHCPVTLNKITLNKQGKQFTSDADTDTVRATVNPANADNRFLSWGVSTETSGAAESDIKVTPKDSIMKHEVDIAINKMVFGAKYKIVAKALDNSGVTAVYELTTPLPVHEMKLDKAGKYFTTEAESDDISIITKPEGATLTNLKWTVVASGKGADKGDVKIESLEAGDKKVKVSLTKLVKNASYSITAASEVGSGFVVSSAYVITTPVEEGHTNMVESKLPSSVSGEEAGKIETPSASTTDNKNKVLTDTGEKFKEADLEINDSGQVTVSVSTASKVAEKVFKDILNGANVSKEDIMPLPIFTAPVADKNKTAMFTFVVTGKDLFAKKTEDVRIFKVLGSTDGIPFTFTSAVKGEMDGHFSIQTMEDNFVDGTIDAAKTYKLCLFIKKGGSFDTSTSVDSITDPAVIYKKAPVAASETTPDTPSGGDAGSGSSGGCNAGFAGMLLLGLIPAFIFKKKD